LTDLSDWIAHHAAFDPDKPALIYREQAITYRRFDGMIADHARALKHVYGVGRGDRVAYLGFNSPEFLALMFACARLGALFIPLNWRLAGPEHLFILRDAAARVMVCEADFKDHADRLRPDLPDCEFVAAGFTGAGWRSLADDVRAAVGDDRNPHVDAELPLLLVYTSGTTGHPKGAVLTQQAVQWNALNSLHMHDMTSADRILTALPMFHVGGLNIQTTPALYAGATVILHRKFDPADVLKSIAGDRPSLIVLVPATIQSILAHPGWAAADISSLRAVTTGSSIVPHPLIEAIHQRGIPVQQVYGSTETCPIAVYLRAGDAMAKVGSTGKAAMHCKIRIVDENDDDVEAGRSGEILVSGPNIMFEYWGNATATAGALDNGWFRSGDIGYEDGDGYLFINDRKTDVIISGGENIYPAELELVMHEIPGVAEAAVVGVVHEKWGEVPVAVAVRSAGSDLDSAAILDRFENSLAHFKHPGKIIFMDALPRNAMGKVQKSELRRRIDPSNNARGLYAAGNHGTIRVK